MGNVHMEARQVNYRGGEKPMSVEEAIKEAGSGYVLPVASAETLGGVKIGNNLEIDDGVLSGPAPYELPNAAADTLGGVMIGDDMKIDQDGAISPVISYPTEYSYVVAKVSNFEISVTKKQDGVTIDTTIYHLSNSTFPADIDNRIRVNYGDGTWSVTLLAASDDYPAEQSWSWLYNQNPTTPASIDYSILDNVVSISAAYGEFKEVEKRIPLPPSTDGSYILGVTVASGTPAYSWVSAT